MSILDFTKAELQSLVTHHVGNKLRTEPLLLSSKETTFTEDTKNYLLKYFFLPIRGEQLYSFTHPIKLDLNDIYSVSKGIFSSPRTFISGSKDVAKLLYEQSTHPKIKEGELNIARFLNVVLEDEVVDAIGIFKSETDVPFLKMQNQTSNFDINHEHGFEIKGVDKACIIFNTDQRHGYKIALLDVANKSGEAQYWKDNFLKVKPVTNEFHQTSQFLGIAKDFVTKQLSEDFPVNKADQIDLLNRSVEYFKTHDDFDKKEFEKEVLKETGIIKSFRAFDSGYREENNIELSDQFGISDLAVKKQMRVFRSVLKLDKNFHIYIHGDRQLIEQGVERDGRKYYKIYFEVET